RLIELFNEAKTLRDREERERFVSQACKTEPELKEQLLSLLQAHEEAGQFLEPHPAQGSERPIAEKPGDKLDHYRLLEKIGEGGCGVVYLAEQEEPVRRLVALKVIKLGMDTRAVV